MNGGRGLLIALILAIALWVAIIGLIMAILGVAKGGGTPL